MLDSKAKGVSALQFLGSFFFGGLFFLLGPLFLHPAIAQSVSPILGGIASTPTHVAASSVVWNPALIGTLNGTQIESNVSMLGGWLIYDKKGFDPNTGIPYASSSTSSLAPNPYLSISSPLGTEHFRFGIASYFPSGAMASFNDTGAQRYELISGYLIPWNNQVTLAYRPNKQFAIAVSGIFSTAVFETELDIDLSRFTEGILHNSEIPSEHAALASRAVVPQTWTEGYGGSIGILYWPTFQWSIGLSFYSPIFYSFDGRLELKSPQILSTLGSGIKAVGVDPIVDNQVSVKTTMPAFLQLGIRFQPYGYWTGEYFGRYTFSSWNRTLAVTINNSNLRALRGFSLPGKDISDSFLIGSVQTFSFWQHWNVGLVGHYYMNGVDDHLLSLTRADFDSVLVGGFADYTFQKRWRLGLEYAHTFMFERTTQPLPQAADDQQPTNKYIRLPVSDAKYRASMDRLGLSVSYAF